LDHVGRTFPFRARPHPAGVPPLRPRTSQIATSAASSAFIELPGALHRFERAEVFELLLAQRALPGSKSAAATCGNVSAQVSSLG